MPRYAWPLIVLAIIVGLLLMFGSRVIVTVPVGHVAVATLFGEVEPEPYKEGLHFPVNPLLKWHFFDARQKTLKDQANVPSQDQLQTKIDVSVQFRLIGNMAARILKGTGSFEDAVNVHLVPNLRSLLREQGKSVERAEDFFAEETQQMLQVGIQRGLQSYLQDKGIEVQAVLIRDITLPTFIIRAIESKKEREQEVEKQRAELERYRTEQQQLVAMARAQREAAEQEAIKRRLLADAQAYEIEKINKAISNNPAYVQLQSLEALKSISKNPSSKIYFLNGDSPQPLPLMNMGESLGGK
jgi:regulator of protease activity HflC (stomatin/prohibitin superfamily)